MKNNRLLKKARNFKTSENNENINVKKTHVARYMVDLIVTQRKLVIFLFRL
jgi:hypothetical protein